MAVEVFMPKMSDLMEVGEVVEWLVQEGSTVEKGQPVLTIMTDKATVDLEAPASGVLKGIREGVKPGANVPVGETMAFIAQPNESVPALSPLTATGAGTSPQAPPPAAAPEQTPVEPGPIRATPVVRRIAKELGVDLSRVAGTGPEGRITEQDVRAYAEAQKRKGASAASVTPSPVSAASRAQGQAEWLDLNSVQRLTGQRMLESVQTAPHFALTVDVDMTHALQFRQAWMDRVVRETGERLSITAVLVKVVASALKQFPRANASFEAGRIKLHKRINIGVAVGTDQGLVVPVIREADEKSMVQITRELKAFEVKASQMRFSVDDLTGGTFTISNLGMFGIDRFTAIIHLPESAILAVGRIVKKPRGLPDDTMALRPIMTLTLSIDHRSLDGVQGAQFLAKIKALIEQPSLPGE